MLEALAPWYSEPGVDLYQGDTRAVMAGLPAESVDCVVFSPPFFGLRKYDGVQELVWGGKEGCEHEWQEGAFQRRSNDSGPGAKQVTNAGSVGRDEPIGHATCSLCGAWRGAWGLEPSVELWVAHTVEVMRAVKRVLKDTGVCFLEVGDSYASTPSGHQSWDGWSTGGVKDASDNYVKRSTIGLGLKPKDLCLVPERLALALQADGWWVRSRIVWAKPNPMPESVTDRPTKSHSTIWMLTKAADYYFDQEAVREAQITDGRGGFTNKATLKSVLHGEPHAPSMINARVNPSGRNLRDVWTLPTQPFGYELCQSCGQIYTAAQFGRLPTIGRRGDTKEQFYEEGIPRTYKDAEDSPMKVCRCGASDFLSHFATFPEALPTRCILASTSEAGCCPKCGKPWERVMGKASQYESHGVNNAADLARGRHGKNSVFATGLVPIMQTLGWAPTCKCGLSQAENVPATVLDVCSGSGTTVLAAKKLGRRAVGIDLSEKYLALAQRRLEQVPLSLGV